MASSAPPPARVGVGVLLVRQGTRDVLVGLRRGSSGAGTLALPGGHLEPGETWERCGAREVAEETGLLIGPCQLCFAWASEGYGTLVLRAEVHEDAHARLLEPEKCTEWRWVQWPDALWPQPLFHPLALMLASGYEL